MSYPNRDTLRFCYDTGTIELRIFVGFGSNRSNIVNFTGHDPDKFFAIFIVVEMFI